MTTATDAATEVAAKRAEWLTSFYRLGEFFTEHPEQIDGTNINVSRWIHNDLARDEVTQFSELTGPNTVSEMGDSSSYVQINSADYLPHSLYLYAKKTTVGHKVRDAVPEEWEWDALGEQS